MSSIGSAPALRDVEGPSAFGGGPKRFWELAWLLSTTDFKLNYLGTAFGYLWSLVRPLLLFGVLYTVFTKIIRFGDQVPHYADLLLFTIMLYTFFNESATRAVVCIPSNEHIVRKTQFPRLVIPLSIVLTGVFNLCLNLVVVFAFLIASGVTPRLSWLALPLIIAVLVILTTGVATLLSVLYVRFRDIAQIWSVLALAIFYASPILYPIELIPSSLKWLLFINPFALLFNATRRLLVQPDAPSNVDVAGSVFGIIGPVIVVVLVCGLGYWAFTRAAPRVAEEL
jgi:ABC-2 type transport system permease protein